MDTLAGWIGTFLGGVALLLALSTLPAAWPDHHHAVYILLWFATIACLAIATVLALRHIPGWVWIRWKVWHAARHRPAAALEGHLIPDSATGSRDFMFTTDDQPRRQIRTTAPPAGLRISSPFEATVAASSLPARVQRYGKMIFRITEFLPSGIVITHQSPGLEIKGEIYYSALTEIIPPPPHETAPPKEPGMPQTDDTP